IRTGIDQEEDGVLLDVVAVLEIHLFEVAGHARLHVDAEDRFGPPREVLEVGDLIGGRTADEHHLGAARGELGLILLTPGECRTGHGERSGANRSRMDHRETSVLGETSGGAAARCEFRAAGSPGASCARSLSLRMPWKTMSRMSCACVSGE